MLFPMAKIHVSETWHELVGGLSHTNLDSNRILQLVMTDALDVLFCKEQKAWLFTGYLSTRTMDDWKVMHVLTGWSLNGSVTRKLLLEDLLKYGQDKQVSSFLFNHGCPWLMGLTGGKEWLRPKW